MYVIDVVCRFKTYDIKQMWIDGEAALSCNGGRYLVVNDSEVGVNGVTHVKMCPHQIRSRAKTNPFHITFHPHYLCILTIFSVGVVIPNIQE